MSITIHKATPLNWEKVATIKTLFGKRGNVSLGESFEAILESLTEEI